MTSSGSPCASARGRRYDGLGARTFLRAGAGVTAPVLSDGQARYSPGVSERRGGTTTYLHSGLKNASAQSGASQTLTGSRHYDAWGRAWPGSSSGTWQGPFAYAGGFGYQTEPDSGLKLLGHRYYDPETGRFLSRDPIQDGSNWYAYGGGDGSPLSFADPEGLWGKHLLERETWLEGLTTSALALGDTLGIVDGSQHAHRPGFGESALAWTVADAVMPSGKVSAPIKHVVAKQARHARADPRTLRRNWENEYGIKWPTTERGVAYIAHHIKPICEGGDNSVHNIWPMHPDDHRKHHAQDAKVWGRLRYR